MREILQTVYTRRPEVTTWTLDVDAKVHEVYGAQKEGAAKAYTAVYALHPIYAFVHIAVQRGCRWIWDDTFLISERLWLVKCRQNPCAYFARFFDKMCIG